MQRELRVRDPGGFLSKLSASHPYLFCAAPLVIGPGDIALMQRTVAAVERIVSNSVYREAVLRSASPIARFDPGNASVFFGYDFHLTDDGPRLIEINTNAGGAMLNAVLSLAQSPSVPGLAGLVMGPAAPAQLETRFMEMFTNEWRGAKKSAPLRTVAIVDEAPAAQYLYPEFLLFQQMFQRQGLHAVITDPRTLVFRDGGLFHRDQRIDLVYNRLTDFSLEADHLAPLRAAYLERAIVLTPHPHAHALYANKANLLLLGDAARLPSFGASDDATRLLTHVVPRTVVLSAVNADALWSERKKWFFKPVSGFGGKAAYRGDKLTKRVWDEIRVAGNYVAQEFVTPSERCVRVDGVDTRLKVDLRCFAYRGAVQHIAARVYQGQTTNFRTPGGGFAPVYSTSFAFTG